MAVVDEVEAQQRRKRPPVRLGDALSHEVAALGKPFLQGIKPMEYFPDRFFVCPLCLGEAGTVDAVVDVLVDKVVYLVDFIAQILRGKVETRVSQALNAELNIRMISDDSLLTIVRRLRSHSVGTVTLPEYSGCVAV